MTGRYIKPHLGPSKYDLDNIAEILSGSGSWFSAHLLRLIMVADRDNRERIRVMFPNHVKVYEDWVK